MCMGYEDPAAPDLRWFWVGWGPRMGGTASGCETSTVLLPRLRSEDASYSQSFSSQQLPCPCLAFWSSLLSPQAATFQQITKLNVLSCPWASVIGLMLLCEPS